ncbi:MAG TPA: hypothetical protein VKT80_00170 [Chloroflexota bacterium]|nr:hypothetical protein [Chloroflexota bacterium]
MKNFLRGVGFFALSIVVAELVKRVVTSPVGRVAADKIGRPDLATLEGAAAVSREAKRAVGLVRTLTTPRAATVDRPVAQEREPGWVGLASDASEMLLAAGALLRAASEFVAEDKKIEKRVARGRAS